MLLLGTYIKMELYFLTNEFMVHFFLLLETTKYMLTSVIEILAHASGLEIEFVDGTLGKSATWMKHFSSGSLSATNVSQAEHKCHRSRILKYHFQKQYTGKYDLSLQFFFTSQSRWNSSIPVKYIRPHHSKVVNCAGFLNYAGFWIVQAPSSITILQILV